MTAVGEITSTPDSNGNHRLKCPECGFDLLEPIKKNDETGELYNVVCNACEHSDIPLKFLYAANKETTDEMVVNYAEREIHDALKKSFKNSKYIKFK